MALLAPPLATACSSYTGDVLPHSMGGLPANAPERPAVPPPFPAVHEMPPPRANTVLTDEERRKAEEDLVDCPRAPARPRQGQGSSGKG